MDILENFIKLHFILSNFFQSWENEKMGYLGKGRNECFFLAIHSLLFKIPNKVMFFQFPPT